MPKKIVLCCDGTGNQFGDQNSNVVKLYQCLIKDEKQVTYYHPGVGTMGSSNALSAAGKWWTKIIGLAFGYGISDNIADAYQFLMHNYQEDGDQLFVFGFSRGAYTARALCGMLHMVGLLRPGHEGLIPYAIRLVKRHHIQGKDFDIADDFKQTFSRECKPYFLGLWDTVKSLGWVYNPVSFPYTTASSNPDLRIIRHAISIDERRAFFRQNSFGKPCSQANPPQDLVEAWFAGVHSDVGGSYPESKSQLSKIALKWMLAEAEAAGLLVDQEWKFDILGGRPAKKPKSYSLQPDWVAPDATTKNQHESLNKWWWIAELWPKVVRIDASQNRLLAWMRKLWNKARFWAKDKVKDMWFSWFRINRGRRRIIPDGALFHESVQQRLDATNIRYRPSNLPADIQANKFKIPTDSLVKDTAPKASAASGPGQ